MLLDKFIKQYDKANAVLLLEGKREVADSDKDKLIALGTLLAQKTNNMLFRSGNAEGADLLFSRGVAAIAPERLQIVMPYSGHRQKYTLTDNAISLDDINLASEPDIVYHSRSNKKNERLVEQFVSGIKNRNTIKAAYILRDTLKVLGSAQIFPATFAIFYDDVQQPMQGGTGHTMQVCKQNHIPYITQEVWFGWI